jgi:AraC-like DNA-binding protein
MVCHRLQALFCERLCDNHLSNHSLLDERNFATSASISALEIVGQLSLEDMSQRFAIHISTCFVGVVGLFFLG